MGTIGISVLSALRRPVNGPVGPPETPVTAFPVTEVNLGVGTAFQWDIVAKLGHRKFQPSVTWPGVLETRFDSGSEVSGRPRRDRPGLEPGPRREPPARRHG